MKDIRRSERDQPDINQQILFNGVVICVQSVNKHYEIVTIYFLEIPVNGNTVIGNKERIEKQTIVAHKFIIELFLHKVGDDENYTFV